MNPALTRRGVIQAGAVVLATAMLPVGNAQAAPAFDPEAFVDDLLKAGCHVSVHSPIGHDAGPPFVYVYPTPDGIQTPGEREVRARWAAVMAACPDANARILAVCQRRSGVRS